MVGDLRRVVFRFPQGNFNLGIVAVIRRYRNSLISIIAILLLLNIMIPAGSHRILFAGPVTLKPFGQKVFLIRTRHCIEVGSTRFVFHKVGHTYLTFFRHYLIGDQLCLLHVAEHNLALGNHLLLFRNLRTFKLFQLF